MTKLLRAECRVLVNLLGTAEGVRLIAVSGIALGCYALMGLGILGKMLRHDGLEAVLARPDADRILVETLGLAFAPVVALSFLDGMKAGERHLYAGSVPELLLTSPVGRSAVLVRALARMVFMNSLWACAWLLPAALLILPRLEAGPVGWLMVPVAALALLVPLLSVAIAVHVAVYRWFGTPRARRAMRVVIAVGGIGVLLALFAGLLGDDAAMRGLGTRWIDARSNATSRPWWLGVPTSLIAWGAGASFVPTHLFGAIAGVAAAPLVLGWAARHYAVSYEHERIASEQAAPGARIGGDPAGGAWRWPRGAAASFRRKAWLQLVQQPAALVGYVLVSLFAIYAFRVLQLDGLLTPDHRAATAAVPRALRETAALLVVSGWLLVMLTPGAVNAFIKGERDQFVLAATAPVSRAAVLRGKLGVTIGSFLFYGIVVATNATLRHGVGWEGLVGFAVCAPPLVLAGLHLGVALGLSRRLAPRLELGGRPTDDGQAARALLSSFAILLLLSVLAAPFVAVWKLVEFGYAESAGPFAHAIEAGLPLPWLLAAGIWIVGLVLRWGGLVWGARNLRRLLDAAP